MVGAYRGRFGHALNTAVRLVILPVTNIVYLQAIAVDAKAYQSTHDCEFESHHPTLSLQWARAI